MASKSTSEIVWKRGNLFFGESGVAPATAVGYVGREGGISVTAGKDVQDYFVDDLKGPALKQTTNRSFMVSCSLAQMTAELLALALGVEADGQTVSLGGSSDVDNQVSFKVVGERRDGKTVTMTCLQALPQGEVAIPFSTDNVTEVPLEIAALDDDANGLVSFVIGDGNIVATLAAGVLTRTADAGYNKIQGEGGPAADTLDSITGTSLTDNETLRLQINSATDVITFTHLAGTLELTGSVDWVMDNLDDYIDLQYDLAGTKWVEIGRHDAR